MRAQQIVEMNGPAGLRAAELAEPTGDGVVVDIVAAGVTYPDLLRAKGEYQQKNTLPYIPGAEASGIVRSAPSGSGFVAGQPVAVMAPQGTWQEVVVVHPMQVFALPDSVDIVSAAGILTNFLTCHFALSRRARAVAGETVLVHGAGGGVGTAALSLAKAMGLRTIGVVSSAAKADAARSAGADDVVDVEGWLDETRRITGRRGVDIVIDPVGGDRFDDSIRSLASEGRLVVLGFTGGSIPTVKVNRLLLRNVSVLGAGLAELLAHEPEYLGKQWEKLYPMLADGSLHVPQPITYDLSDAAPALASLESRSAVGKIVLNVRDKETL